MVFGGAVAVLVLLISLLETGEAPPGLAEVGGFSDLLPAEWGKLRGRR